MEYKSAVLDLDAFLSGQPLFLGLLTTQTFLPVLVLRDLLCLDLLLRAR
jgi:hypothetical protein